METPVNIRTRLKDPKTSLRLGLSFLLLALLSRWWMPHVGVPETARDLAMGVAYGIAIGTLLLSVRANGRRA